MQSGHSSEAGANDGSGWKIKEARRGSEDEQQPTIRNLTLNIGPLCQVVYVAGCYAASSRRAICTRRFRERSRSHFVASLFTT